MHPQVAVFHVYIGPGQPQRLAATESERQGHPVEGVEAIVTYDLQEPLGILGTPSGEPGPVAVVQAQVLRRVLRKDGLFSHRVLESRKEDSM